MKREDLPLVTPAQFIKFNPCWLFTEDGRARFRRVAAQRPEWNALDVLDLEDVSARDKLWSVLREEFLPSMLLHEFACRCAEYALSLVENPDARSVEAIRVKRRWMTGEVADYELRAARIVARAAASEVAARYAEGAAWAAEGAAARREECAAAWASDRAAEFAAVMHGRMDNGRDPEWAHEVAMLRKLIDEWE